MLTLRTLPMASPPPGLSHFYHGELQRHWRRSDRWIARLLSLAQFGGWSRSECRLLDADIRAGGLSMADRKGLHRLLNPGAFPLASNPLKNKALFARVAGRAGLPVPESFDPDLGSLAGWLACRDAIIAKPSYRSKGEGIVGFARIDGIWHDRDKALSDEALAARLAPIAAAGVIQTRLPTHADLAGISIGALPTLRVMTCLDEAGEPEACDIGLRLSLNGDRPVDNFNAGNLVCAVDDSGRCGPAYGQCDGAIATFIDHPVSLQPIVGRSIPDLDAAIALALRAHRVFRGGFTVIGWDIGLSTRGPMLIEGNWNPGTDILQLVGRAGVGKSRLGALYRHHLARVAPDRWRAARPIEREPRRG